MIQIMNLLIYTMTFIFLHVPFWSLSLIFILETRVIKKLSELIAHTNFLIQLVIISRNGLMFRKIAWNTDRIIL